MSKIRWKFVDFSFLGFLLAQPIQYVVDLTYLPKCGSFNPYVNDNKCLKVTPLLDILMFIVPKKYQYS